MKNIHVLPTDKPSRLYFYKGDDKYPAQYGLRSLKSLPFKDSFTNQNIYITSDEEIKDCDCYVINVVGEIGRRNVFKPIKVTEEIVRKEPLIAYPNGGWCKKIILTTDQDLIKDGVQAIDDEFLEWFVKNPSFEEVEVEKILIGKVEGTTMSVSKYKLIIPQEEPKQETLEKYNYLQGFINQFLKWMKINNFIIVKDENKK
jgi:hypothetical protein